MFMHEGTHAYPHTNMHTYIHTHLHMQLHIKVWYWPSVEGREVILTSIHAHILPLMVAVGWESTRSPGQLHKHMIKTWAMADLKDMHMIKVLITIVVLVTNVAQAACKSRQMSRHYILYH